MEATETSPLPPFDDNLVVRKSTNFQIMMGYKKDIPGEERLFIVPLNDSAEELLISAYDLHNTKPENDLRETRLVSIDGGEELLRLCIRMNFSPENWKDLVEGDKLTIPSADEPDTMPTIKRLEELMVRKQLKYSFQD